MSKQVSVTIIEAIDGVVRFEVRFEVHYIDSDNNNVVEQAGVHRAALSADADLSAELDKIEAQMPDFPAISVEDRQALAGAFATCPPRPPEQLTLVDLKLRLADALEDHRDRALSRFVINTVSVPLNSRIEEQMAYLYQALDRQPADTTIEIEVRRGVYRSLNRTQIGAIIDAAFTHRRACMANASALVDQIIAATTAEELAAVDVTAGWP